MAPRVSAESLVRTIARRPYAPDGGRRSTPKAEPGHCAIRANRLVHPCDRKSPVSSEKADGAKAVGGKGRGGRATCPSLAYHSLPCAGRHQGIPARLLQGDGLRDQAIGPSRAGLLLTWAVGPAAARGFSGGAGVAPATLAPTTLAAALVSGRCQESHHVHAYLPLLVMKPDYIVLWRAALRQRAVRCLSIPGGGAPCARLRAYGAPRASPRRAAAPHSRFPPTRPHPRSSCAQRTVTLRPPRCPRLATPPTLVVVCPPHGPRAVVSARPKGVRCAPNSPLRRWHGICLRAMCVAPDDPCRWCGNGINERRFPKWSWYGSHGLRASWHGSSAMKVPMGPSTPSQSDGEAAL